MKKLVSGVLLTLAGILLLMYVSTVLFIVFFAFALFGLAVYLAYLGGAKITVKHKINSVQTAVGYYQRGKGFVKY